VVLDDGFQHRQLARQLDIVLIDATRDPFRDEVLPAGWLREPVGSLRRAQAMVITHAESVRASDLAAIRQRVLDLCPAATVAICRHAWALLTIVERGREREEVVQWLAGRRVVAACAIGNPGPFMEGVRSAAKGEVSSIVLRDHDPFGRSTVERVLRILRDARAEALVVTEKDWSKLRRWPPETWPCPVVRAKLGLTFDSGEGDLARLIVGASQAVPE
jgi:tetraacyldisaccharide 4'-kinase